MNPQEAQEAQKAQEAFQIADRAVYHETGKHLTDMEHIVFMGAYQGKTYQQIADEAKYSVNHLQRDVGCKLFTKLSQSLGEEVSKINFKEALKRRQSRDNYPLKVAPEFPTRPIALNSPFYIKRPPLEELCYHEVLRSSGSLIRIKAPGRMGKTSLVWRIIDRAKSYGCQTVRLSFSVIDRENFTDLDRFLKWLCDQITSELQLEPELERYWSKSSMTGCTTYFQEHLLPQVSNALVLVLDEIERLFEYPKMVDFFSLLRSFYEEANNLDIWQKLRLVVVHATEPFIRLDINSSPFENVGLPIKLPPFNLQQVEELANCYELSSLTRSETEKLQTMLGGHPYLLQLAFYHLKCEYVTLNQLFEKAPTSEGIYSDHLRGLLETIKENQRLVAALKQILEEDSSVQLEPKLSYYLECMGLVQMEGNYVRIICDLYRSYFRQYLP